MNDELIIAISKKDFESQYNMLKQKEKEIKQLKEENEHIRQTHFSQETLEVVIGRIKTDTVREFTETLLHRYNDIMATIKALYNVNGTVGLGIAVRCLITLAKEYGIELKDGEE